MAIDLNKQVDEHGLMLDSIHNNVIGANTNLQNMNEGAKKQGEQIDRIGNEVIEIDQSVKKTGKVFDEMEVRLCCRKFIVVIGIILLFCMNIIIMFLILAKFFKWNPDLFGTSKAKAIKGIEIKCEGSPSFEKFKEKEISFVMFQVENDSDECKEIIDKAKNQKIKVGLYWKITATDFSEAMEMKIFKNYQKTVEYNSYFSIEDTTLKENGENVNSLCEEVSECGIKLNYDNYKNNFKKYNLDKIKHYWIENYSEDFDKNKETKVVLWTKKDQIEIDEDKYDIIEARK